MGAFHEMANGVHADDTRDPKDVFTVSKRRSPGTVFLKQTRRVSPTQITGIPNSDPRNPGALYRDTSNFIKVSSG